MIDRIGWGIVEDRIEYVTIGQNRIDSNEFFSVFDLL